MTVVVKCVAAISVLGLAACADPGSAPRDTGSMATPAPVATGTMNRPAQPMSPTSSTGNMAYPAPVAGSGVLAPAPTGRDTGSMAIPESSMGNLRRAPAAR